MSTRKFKITPQKLMKLTEEGIALGIKATEANRLADKKQSEMTPADHAAGGNLAAYDRAAEEIATGIDFPGSISRKADSDFTSKLARKVDKDFPRIIRRLAAIHNSISRTSKKLGVEPDPKVIDGLRHAVAYLQEILGPKTRKFLKRLEEKSNDQKGGI